MGVVLGVAIAITLLLMPLSIYPGLLSELAFFALISSPFWMPATCISLWAFIDIARQVPDLTGPPPGRRRWLALAAAVLGLNASLLAFSVPRRLAFLHARPAFEALVAAAPLGSSSSDRIGRQLGAFHVDLFAADPRGGVYFRSHSGPDGFYTNRTTYGFSHRPNRTGCPFGDEKYALSHIVGDWYAFQASSR